MSGGVKQVKAWVYDAHNRNLISRLTFRYHREAWCISDQPYGTTVGPVCEYDGNPNDFECEHCGHRFRRVVVPAELAKQLRRVSTESFTGTNGLEDTESYPTSERLSGCDCLSGYEHAQRGPHPTDTTGTNPPGEEVPLVFGEWVVPETNQDKQNLVKATENPEADAQEAESGKEDTTGQVVPNGLPTVPVVYRSTGKFRTEEQNPYREGAYPEDDLLDLTPVRDTEGGE